MMKTDVITYNLKDRGRKFRGQDRDYSKPENLQQLVSGINSGATQEKVKYRDMLGFYGHNIRQLFGLLPPECAFLEGKKILIEPDLVTTKLKAYKDGTVEHIAEFTQSEGGEKAWKLYSDKIGGFSSAISETSATLHGFDYVFEPNYAKNRGHSTFDSVGEDKYQQLVFDYEEHVQGTFDKVTSVLASMYKHNDQDLILTLDRIDDLEKKLDEGRLALVDYRNKSILIGRTKENRGSAFDSANDFLNDPDIDRAINQTNGVTDDDSDLILPKAVNPLRRALLSSLRKR